MSKQEGHKDKAEREREMAQAAHNAGRPAAAAAHEQAAASHGAAAAAHAEAERTGHADDREKAGVACLAAGKASLAAADGDGAGAELVAVLMPNATNEEVRAEIERLLGFCREDTHKGGDHGTYLGPGPKIVRVTSVHPDIYVGGVGDFGPDESVPVAKAKLKEEIVVEYREQAARSTTATNHIRAARRHETAAEYHRKRADDTGQDAHAKAARAHAHATRKYREAADGRDTQVAADAAGANAQAATDAAADGDDPSAYAGPRAEREAAKLSKAELDSMVEEIVEWLRTDATAVDIADVYGQICGG